MAKVLKTVVVIAVAVAVVVFAPQIAAVLASVAGSLGVTVAATALSSALIGMGISMALAAVATMFRKAPSMSQSLADRLNTSVVPTASRKIVFGTTAGGQDVRFFEGDVDLPNSKKDGYVQVIALASHRISAFRDFYVENDLVWSNGTFLKHRGGFAPNNPFRTVLEGKPGNGFSVGSGRYWNSTSTFTGCAYYVPFWKLDEKVWESGIPQRLTAIVDGCPVYDPRRDSTRGGSGSHRIDDQDTWGFRDGSVEYGRNPALALLTYLIGWRVNGKLMWGMGIPAHRIDFDNFCAYANVCEERVATQGGGTVQRYHFDGIFSTTDSHETIINGITAAMGSCKMTDRGGTYCLVGGYDDTAGPKIAFEADDLVAPSNGASPYIWTPAPPSRERFNIVRGRFANPDELYQLTDWGDPIEREPLADNIPRTLTLDLGGVSRPETCQRIAKQFLLREYLCPGKFSATFGPKAFAVEIGDVITLSLPAEGWNNKLFRVEEQAWTEQAGAFDHTLGKFTFTSNAPGIRVEVQARFRMTSGVYSPWVSATVQTAAVETVDNTARSEAGIAKQTADTAIEKVETVRQQLPELVTPLVRKPFNDVAALQIEYGASMGKATLALHDQNLVAIRTLETDVNTNGAKVAKELLQLTTRVDEAEKDILGIDIEGPIEAGLSDLRKTIADANYASSEAVDLKIANYGKGVSAWQTNEERVRTDNDKALSEDIRKMGVSIRSDFDGEITTLEGAFNDLRKVTASKEEASALALSISDMGVRITNEVGGEKTEREAAFRLVEESIVDGNKATSERIDALGTRITTDVGKERTDREAAIQTVEKSIVDGDKSVSGRVDTLSASVDKITAADGPIVAINSTIKTMQETQASDNGTRAGETKALRSRLDNFNGASLEQSFKTYADKVDGVGASYDLKVETDQNGQRYIAGMGIAIENGASEIVFQANQLKFIVPGSTAFVPFRADATGLYAPNLIVENINANSIDSASLKQAAASKTSFSMLDSDKACPRDVSTTVISYMFHKEDSDSILRIMMFAQCYNQDDLDFFGDFILDGNSKQRAQVRMPFDNANSRGQAPITPFVFLTDVPAGEHTISFTLTSNETEGPTYVRAGSTLEVTELRRASIGNVTGNAAPVDSGGGGGGGGGDYGGGGGGGGYDPNVNIA